MLASSASAKPAYLTDNDYYNSEANRPICKSAIEQFTKQNVHQLSQETENLQMHIFYSGYMLQLFSIL